MAKHWHEKPFLIHCSAPLGDGYVLCGASIGGVNDDEAWQETAAQINCSQCISVLNFCRTVRPGEVCSPIQRRAQR